MFICNDFKHQCNVKSWMKVCYYPARLQLRNQVASSKGGNRWGENRNSISVHLRLAPVSKSTLIVTHIYTSLYS